VELRPTTDDDLPALHAIFNDAIGSVFLPHGFEPPAPSLATFTNLQGHIRRTGTSVVAEEDGSVVGYGSSWTRGDDWFLASLFVAPAVHGRGVGTSLLDAVWTEAKRRRTMTDAIQPISNSLYGRRGLVPATPVLTFYGRPQIDAPVEPEAADLARIDELSYGFDRAVDHRHWSQHARRTEWQDAYSYAFPGGEIGPVAGATPAAAASALVGELGAAKGEVRVRLPGSARLLVEVALAAGLRLAPVPGLLLLSRGVDPPSALAPSSYALY
jgi:predicted GNAT family acetyltransferase